MPKDERFSRDALLAGGAPLAAQSRQVRFQDVDAAGTIYYARTFEYFGDVYLELLSQSGLDVPGMLSRQELAAPLIHAEADYLAPLRFGDRVSVELVLARIGTSSTSYGYRILAEDGRPAAVGQTVHVWVDGRSFRPAPVPEALRHHLSGRDGVSSS